MGKNVAVFVDVANIFYAAKAAGVDIDYVTLLKAGSAGRDLVRAYAYTGLDPENENQRNFHEFLRRHGYKVVSKDIRKYGDGKVKANLDIELVVDMMKTARNLDVAIVVSGDGDFAPAIRAVQEMGVRVEVVSFRGNTSSDLMDVADLFTDITQIAKVEKGSSRSGRRVADDEQDLSMTEVPEKQSEGTGERTRGRGRTRRSGVAAATTTTARGRSRAAEDGEPSLTVLPGEKLSRVAAGATTDADEAESEELVELVEGDEEGALGADGAIGEAGPRRRRRRGGRGRGRSRGREEGAFVEGEAGLREAAGSAGGDEDEEMPAPARRAASAFGSVWESQIGRPAASRGPQVIDDEEDDEPSVPEYLITERRQQQQRGGMRGGRGGRGGAYAAALERERFGGGRGSMPSRFSQPAPSSGGYGRGERSDRADRDRQSFRPAPRPISAPAPRGTDEEPWSEVPPEIEAMLRAQLGSRPAPRREAAPVPAMSAAPAEAPAAEAAPAARRGRRPAAKAAAAEAPAQVSDAAEAAPKARRTTTRKPKADAAEATEAPAAKPARAAKAATPRATSRAKAKAADAPAEQAAGTDGEAPKKRATRRKTAAEG